MEVVEPVMGLDRPRDVNMFCNFMVRWIPNGLKVPNGLWNPNGFSRTGAANLYFRAGSEPPSSIPFEPPSSIPFRKGGVLVSRVGYEPNHRRTQTERSELGLTLWSTPSG